MSIVGTRPPLISETNLYELHHRARLVFPKYLEEYEKNVKKGAGNYSALHLSTKIKEYITYKAWKEGILVIDVQAKDTQKICAVCGGEIVERDKTRQESICANGHGGVSARTVTVVITCVLHNVILLFSLFQFHFVHLNRYKNVSKGNVLFLV